MGQLRIDGENPMTLDTDTGILKPIRRLAAIDWLLKYAEIKFMRVGDRTEATFLNVKILEDGKEYEAKGTGELANDAVKELAEDIKGEHIVVATPTGEIVKYHVDDKLQFSRE